MEQDFSSYQNQNIEEEEDDFPTDSDVSDYSKISLIGSGVYGTVYKAISKKTGGLVALKKVKLNMDTEGISASALREISILRNLNHENIEKILDVVITETKILMVFEYLEYDLEMFYDLYTKGKINETINIINSDEQMTKIFLKQILKGMEYCHAKKVIHRDLKPQNILVSKEGVLKIADFGLSRMLSSHERPYTKEILSLWYRAPEMLMGASIYTESVDIWSLGCLFGFMVLKDTLFKGDNEMDQLNKIFQFLGTPKVSDWPQIQSLPNYNDKFIVYPKQNFETKFPNLNKEGIDLMKRMLCYDPGKRISCKQALCHPYFKGD